MKRCGPVVFYFYISLSSLMLFFTSPDSFKLPYPSYVQHKHTNYYKSLRSLVIWEIIKWLHCIFLHWRLCFSGKHSLDFFEEVNLGSVRLVFSVVEMLLESSGSQQAHNSDPQMIVTKVWESWLQRKPEVLRARSKGGWQEEDSNPERQLLGVWSEV